jgi:hypothetical protein
MDISLNDRPRPIGSQRLAACAIPLERYRGLVACRLKTKVEAAYTREEANYLHAVDSSTEQVIVQT